MWYSSCISSMWKEREFHCTCSMLKIAFVHLPPWSSVVWTVNPPRQHSICTTLHIQQLESTLKPKAKVWLLHSSFVILLQANGSIHIKSWCLLSPHEVSEKGPTNTFRAERKEERWEMERGWVLRCVGEAARIHYLSVLYLFHMLLLSNLSLQIQDSENKQMDQSCRLLPLNAPLQTPQRHTAAALPRGQGQKCSDGWMDGWMDKGHIGISVRVLEIIKDRSEEMELLTLLSALSDPLLWPSHPWSSRLLLVSLTPPHPLPSPALFF